MNSVLKVSTTSLFFLSGGGTKVIFLRAKNVWLTRSALSLEDLILGVVSYYLIGGAAPWTNGNCPLAHSVPARQELSCNPFRFVPDRTCLAPSSWKEELSCHHSVRGIRNCPATIQFVARGIVPPPFSSWQEEMSCHNSVRDKRNCPTTIQFVAGGNVLPPVSSFKQDVSCRPVRGKIHSSWQTAVVLSPILVVANSNCPAIHWVLGKQEFSCYPFTSWQRVIVLPSILFVATI